MGGIKIDVTKYLDVLSRAGFKDEAEKLGQVLGNYSQKGEVTVLEGVEVGGDKALLFSYIVMGYPDGAGIPGALRFSSSSGEVYDSLAGKTIPSISPEFAKVFFGGILGETDDPSAKVILSARGCYDADETTACSYQGIDEGLKLYMQKGDAIWEKAKRLILLAGKADIGPGGIEPDDLSKISSDYAKKSPTTFSGAKQYYDSAREMFLKMVSEESGYKSLAERGGEIGCFSGYDDPSCGITSFEVECKDIGVSTTVIHHGGTCSPPREPPDKSSWEGPGGRFR